MHIKKSNRDRDSKRIIKTCFPLNIFRGCRRDGRALAPWEIVIKVGVKPSTCGMESRTTSNLWRSGVLRGLSHKCKMLIIASMEVCADNYSNGMLINRPVK